VNKKEIETMFRDLADDITEKILSRIDQNTCKCRSIDESMMKKEIDSLKSEINVLKNKLKNVCGEDSSTDSID